MPHFCVQSSTHALMHSFNDLFFSLSFSSFMSTRVDLWYLSVCQLFSMILAQDCRGWYMTLIVLSMQLSWCVCACVCVFAYVYVCVPTPYECSTVSYFFYVLRMDVSHPFSCWRSVIGLDCCDKKQPSLFRVWGVAWSASGDYFSLCAVMCHKHSNGEGSPVLKAAPSCFQFLTSPAHSLLRSCFLVM